MNPVSSFVIDRGLWLTGTALRRLDDSMLREPKSGLMCCLGQYGKSCGLTHDDMNDVTTIMALPAETRRAIGAEWLQKPAPIAVRTSMTDVSVQDVMVTANDRTDGVHQSRREAKIVKLFKQFGNIDVTFTGRYADATARARAAVKA